ncbi:MAG TPA: methyltransferase domain-containing protein [Ramlibacter sp.]|jgi:ubiquinone/menaquinone biosynthesis C-methylase UbiE
MKEPQAVDVAVHYDSPESQMAVAIFEGHMHLGWWDEETAEGPYARASENFTARMVARARIGAGQRFVDLGCGVGVPALRLAEATGCEVDGLTISAFQQADATRRAAAAGLQERVRFTCGDVLHAPYADASFDGGWFFESIFHMGHGPALATAQRILKPGAELLVADLTLRPIAGEAFRAYARRQMVSSFVAQADYPRLLAANGFELLELEDVSARVMPQLVPAIRATIDQHREAILEAVGPQVIEDTLTSFQAMRDNLEYVLVRARRLG